MANDGNIVWLILGICICIYIVTCLGLFVCELLELFLKYSELFLKYAQLCVQYVELFPKI